MKFPANLSDVRGLSRLVIHRAAAITELVEELHVTIAGGQANGPEPFRAGGITGLVYRGIQSGYQLVGSGIDAALGAANLLFDPPVSTPGRETGLAVLNGILGDYLAESQNPLAIRMAVRSNGQALRLEKQALREAFPQAGGRVAVLVHGLCMNDLQWLRNGHNHGSALAGDLGYTPVYLHYNSGLHISSNGRSLADLLETLLQVWPQPVEELVIIGHSMGGLVARSACHYGSEAGQAWRQQLRSLVFLGVPHHGAAWERIGNWVEEMLKVSLYTAPFRRLGMNRSAGITDLRYGNLVDEDWEGLDRFAYEPDNRRVVALPEGVACSTVGVSLGARAGDVKDRLLGDGLVLLDSALGMHTRPERSLTFGPGQQWTSYRMGHLELLSRPEIYQQVRGWLH